VDHVAHRDQGTSPRRTGRNLRLAGTDRRQKGPRPRQSVADRHRPRHLRSTTPDYLLPSSACLLQQKIGAPRAGAFDLNAACSSFIYGLSVGTQFIRAGGAKRILVVCGEVLTRFVNWKDRGTCVLFGDGAGAVVLRAVEGGQRGILSTHIHSDGRDYDLLYVDGGPSSTRGTGYLRMEGREVFRQAVHCLSAVVDEALAANGLIAADVDWLVPHQANSRIIDGMGRKLGLPEDKIVVTIERHANTSAASIPLALETAVADGRIKPGHLVLMEALGGGLSWGASLVRW